MTVAEAIIGVLGVGLLGMLGIFLQAIRSDIGALGTRLDRVEERLAGIEATQAEMGATLAEHGRLLAQMMGHGERIAALEGRAGVD